MILPHFWQRKNALAGALFLKGRDYARFFLREAAFFLVVFFAAFLFFAAI
jgi:hypothetical protein